MTRDRAVFMAGAMAAPILAIVFIAAQSAVVICHHPSPIEDPFSHPVTRVIPASALEGHLKHGDTIGPCSPEATPRPTVRPTPGPTPRPTPGPTFRPTPRPTPRATPLPQPTPVFVPTQPPTDTD